SASPWGIAAAPDGHLWFTETTIDRIGRIAPAELTISPTSVEPDLQIVADLVGFGFADGAAVTIGGLDTAAYFFDETHMEVGTPILPPGTLNEVRVVKPNGALSVRRGGLLVDFLDMPQDDPFHDFVETIVRRGVTVGCGGGNYCRD